MWDGGSWRELLWVVQGGAEASGPSPNAAPRGGADQMRPMPHPVVVRYHQKQEDETPMSSRTRDGITVFLQSGVVKFSEWVEAVRYEGWEASAARKGQRLHEAIKAIVAAGMGRRPREGKRAWQTEEPSRWRCKRCGPVSRVELSYSGCYERTGVFEEGSVRVPSLCAARRNNVTVASSGPLWQRPVPTQTHRSTRAQRPASPPRPPAVQAPLWHCA